MLKCGFICSLLLASYAAAQNSRIFGWKFGGSFFSNNLPACESKSIIVQPFDTSSPADALGVPPYFMLALAVGSTPRIYPLGSDRNRLEWTVDLPPQTELLLTVIDSNNTSGGVPVNMYTVVAGQNLACVKPVDANSDFKITANVTSTINTCQPWGLTVQGGTPPYHWTLAQIKSPVVTNVTGNVGDDEMVYIMRGDVGQKLFAAVSDSTGRFAYGTPVITPQGSTDVTCSGLVTVTGSSSTFQEQMAAAQKASADSSRRKGMIIGVVVAIIVLVVLGLIAAFVFIRRRKTKRLPDPFMTGNDGKPIQENLRVDPYRPLPSPLAPSPSQTTPSTLTSRPSFTTFPVSSAARRKQLLASQPTPSTPSPSTSLPSTSQTTPGTSMQQARQGEEIIIQHQDGGGIIRELPPPYMDRGASNQPEST